MLAMQVFSPDAVTLGHSERTGCVKGRLQGFYTGVPMVL